MRTISEILKDSGWSEKDFEAFWLECAMNYTYFAKHVLGFQIAPYHEEWYSLAERFKRLCIIAFRGSGKTSFFAGYFLWKACFNENLEFLIISNSLLQSKDIIKMIRDTMSNNELLQQLIPEGKEFFWSSMEITTKTNCRFSCRPYNPNVRGKHPDYVMMDEAGEYDDKSIFWNVISPTVDLKLGRIIVIGTPKSPMDLLMELFYENDEYYSKIYPIVSNGEPLWKQRYTMEKHDIFNKRSIPQIMREKGELPFQQEYMCKPIGSANSLFPFELLSKAKAQDKTFIPYGRQNKRYFVGCDFAISDKARGDYSVFLVLEESKDGHLTVANMLRMKATDFSFQKEAILKLNKDFNPIKILIDQTGMGEAFYNDLKNELPNVFGFHFSASEKERILLNLRHQFEKGNITIPYSKEDNHTYSMSQVLFKELNEMVIRIKKAKTSYVSAGKHDDTVMALALANEATRSKGYGNVSISFI